MQTSPVYRHENVLGTLLETCFDSLTPARAEGAAWAEIDRLANVLSSYDASSEFSRWTLFQHKPVHVSPELMKANGTPHGPQFLLVQHSVTVLQRLFTAEAAPSNSDGGITPSSSLSSARNMKSGGGPPGARRSCAPRSLSSTRPKSGVHHGRRRREVPCIRSGTSVFQSLPSLFSSNENSVFTRSGERTRNSRHLRCRN